MYKGNPLATGCVYVVNVQGNPLATRLLWADMTNTGVKPVYATQGSPKVRELPLHKELVSYTRKFLVRHFRALSTYTKDLSTRSFRVG